MNFDLKELCKADGGIYRVETLEDSYNFCKKAALGHYENFPVGSILLPKDKRKYVFSIYAFARSADDIADENQIPQEQKINYLNIFKNFLYKFSNSNEYSTEIAQLQHHPIFASLHDAMKKLSIPAQTLEKLLIAFVMDAEFRQAVDWQDTLNYCSYSANPVGELILRIFNEYNKENVHYSDKICTGLQLANFWQDISVDLKNRRHYIPKEIFKKHKIDQENLLIQKNSIIFSSLLDEIIDYTFELFKEGKTLVHLLKSRRLRLEISITVNGGKAILKKVEKSKNDILFKRPKLSKLDFMGIILKSFIDII